GDEPVERAERGRAGKYLHARGPGARRELARVGHAALGEQAPARLGALRGPHDVGPELRRRSRGAQTGGPTPNHEDVGMTAAVLRAPPALGLRPAQLPPAGGCAED